MTLTGNANLALPGSTTINRPEYRERDTMPTKREVLVCEINEGIDDI